MLTTSETDERLLQQAAHDLKARDELFARHRDRLTAMVRLRLDQRLQQRVDGSDVVQDALLEAARKFDEYAAAPQLPFYLWLRQLAGLKLAEAHVRHLGTQKRDARLEVPLHRLGVPEASSVALAEQFAASITSPSQAVMKAELHERIREQLEAMDATDREILVLRHFEQLSTAEAAHVLGMSKAGAGGRYLRAIKRLRAAVQLIPGLSDVGRISH